MGLKEWLIPQDKMFFGMLVAESEKVLEGAKALKELLENFTDVLGKSEKIKDIEHECDKIVHGIYEALNRTFITPIDREDISALASKMDEVLDYINSASIRLCIYEVKAPTKSMKEFADVILNSMVELNYAINHLNNMKNAKKIEKNCVEVNRLENEADEILHNAIASLFKENDVIRVIKLKEIYEHLEQATDMCEDVANIISDVVTKYR